MTKKCPNDKKAASAATRNVPTKKQSADKAVSSAETIKKTAAAGQNPPSSRSAATMDMKVLIDAVTELFSPAAKESAVTAKPPARPEPKTTLRRKKKENPPAKTLPDEDADAQSESESEEVTKRDSLKAYMGEIECYPLISQEDEIQLAGFIQGSDPVRKAKAYESLVVSNLRLVVKIAHDFKGMGLNLPDLISEGNIGLMRAAEKFNPAKGAKFSSYAAWWIKQAILRAIMNQTRTIRIPAQSGHKMMQIRKMRDSLRLRLGREPLDSEIAAELHFSERTVSTLRLAETSIFSLNDPIQTGENDTFEELISDPNAKSPERLAGDQDSFHRLREALNKLDPREREIIELRFFRKQTLEAVSLLIGRTRERVRQIQNQALGKLQLMLKDEADAANF